MSDSPVNESFPSRVRHGSAEEVFGPLRAPVETPELKEPRRIERFGKRAGEMWDNRPDLLEVHYIYLPIALAAGALAVGTIDKTFNFHLAERMARVHVDKRDNTVERTFENVVHKIGVEAVKAEK